MLAIDRANSIHEALLSQDSVSVTELSRRFSVSEETIRRDLDKMGRLNKNIIRVHGGAYLVKSFDREAPFPMRETLLVEQKQEIALRCLPLVEDGDCLMLDSSTTALYLARLIKTLGYKLVIITNSLSIVEELTDSTNFKLVCVGGNYRSSSRSFNGCMAERMLMEYRANKAFVSCSGIHPRFGLTDNSEEEAQVRRQMLKNAVARCLLVDHEKFGRCKLHAIADLSGVNMVSTHMPLPEPWAALFAKKGITVLDDASQSSKKSGCTVTDGKA